MSLPINRSAKATLDSNLVNGITSDAPALKASDDVVYNTIDELYNYTSGLVAGGVLQPYPAFLSRQAIINGNFDIWQRGTSFTANNIYTADRWLDSISAAAATVIKSRQSFTIGQTTVPNNPKYFMRINPTVLTSCIFFTKEQRIYGVDKFAGQTVTVSFWAKADTAQTISAFLRQNFGTGGAPSADAQVTGSNIVLTTTWTNYTATFTLPSISGKTLGSNANDYLAFGFNLPLTGSYSIDLAQALFNTGSIALPFQPKSDNQENLDSLRYRWQSWADAVNSPSIGSISGYASANNTLVFNMRFPVPMRISPTITITNNNVTNQVRNTSTGVVVAVTPSFFLGSSNKGNAGVVLTGTPLTVGQYYDFDAIADAEI